MAPSRSAATAENPSYLPSRYEIRKLTEAHIPWAAAIVVHTNCFNSTFFPVIYPEKKTERCYKAWVAADYLVRHQVESGMSFGVFDTEYVYKRPESAATEGKLYWDVKNLEATRDDLEDQMDFPLVSVALAYDQANPLDYSQMDALIDSLPLFTTIYKVLGDLDPRDPESWVAKGPHEVLMRNATSTRRPWEGKGIMGKLARFLMREAHSKGYRGAQIECLNDAVTYVWSNPPAPFKGSIVSKADSATFELEDESGKKYKPFAPSKQLMTKVYCNL